MTAGEAMGGESKGPIYLGVDVAGASNTWGAALSLADAGPGVVCGPRKATLRELVRYCDKENVVAAAIDAQLTIALSEENGFRTSDTELRGMLAERDGSRNWVASFNSLTAVPIRGRMLAEHLAPTVGTLLETHPRASLLFALGDEAREHVWKFKGKEGKEVREAHTWDLWQMWSERFGIIYDGEVSHDGELDALVCATVAYLYHHTPDGLYRLRHNVSERTGRGPFYVASPDSRLNRERSTS